MSYLSFSSGRSLRKIKVAVPISAQAIKAAICGLPRVSAAYPMNGAAVIRNPVVKVCMLM